MKRPGYTLTAIRWTPDGHGGYVMRPEWQKDRPGQPAPPEHRPQRWARGDARLGRDDQALLL